MARIVVIECEDLETFEGLAELVLGGAPAGEVSPRGGTWWDEVGRALGRPPAVRDEAHIWPGAFAEASSQRDERAELDRRLSQPAPEVPFTGKTVEVEPGRWVERADLRALLDLVEGTADPEEPAPEDVEPLPLIEKALKAKGIKSRATSTTKPVEAPAPAETRKRTTVTGEARAELVRLVAAAYNAAQREGRPTGRALTSVPGVVSQSSGYALLKEARAAGLVEAAPAPVDPPLAELDLDDLDPPLVSRKSEPKPRAPEGEELELVKAVAKAYNDAKRDNEPRFRAIIKATGIRSQDRALELLAQGRALGIVNGVPAL